MQRSRRQLTANLLEYALSGGAHISAPARHGNGPCRRAARDCGLRARDIQLGPKVQVRVSPRDANTARLMDGAHALDNIRISIAFWCNLKYALQNCALKVGVRH